MAAYTKQTWDTTSVFNPTRMNHIEEGIYGASTNIADNLTTDDSTKCLSAKQGKVLNDKLTVEDISLTNVTWNKTINSNYTWFEKMGNMVSFQIYITENISGNFTLASNLPTNVRPSKQKWFEITNSMGGNLTARLNILTDGSIGVLSGSTAIGNGFVSGTYFL